MSKDYKPFKLKRKVITQKLNIMKQFFKTVFASTLGMLIAFAIIIVGSIFLMIGVSASMDSAPSYKPDKNSVFKISLKGNIVEQAAKNPLASLFGDSYSQTGLADLRKAIRTAKEDDRIKGIYLEAGNLSTGFATAQAIRKELSDFKESGKFIVSYGDSYSQRAYYVASVADSVFLNPQGNVALVGLASQGMFFTGLEEKLGVEVYIFKVGTYKSAVEPFFLKKFSDANRQQLTSFLGSIWGTITTAIEKDRKVSSEQLNKYLNDGLAVGEAKNAIDYKLVDALYYRFEAENAVKAMAGQEGKENLKTASLEKVCAIKKEEKKSKNKIAILYAEGEIVEKSPTSSPFSDEEKTITEETAKQLLKLQKDEDVKAVVFRVNSPGGSAFVSEVIWKAVSDLKAVKPVVVSMGDYAASGGYYISCAANKIYAEPTTLTGSIGVFGIYPNFTGTFEKVGVSTDVVKTNTYADLGDASRPMKEDEKALIQQSVEQIYALFLKRCADGRHKTSAEIDSIGQGRVWTGEQGVELGLVDKLGGMDDAINEAATLADLTDYQVIDSDAPKDFITKLLEDKMNDAKISMVKSMLGEEYTIFKMLQKAKTERGIKALMPYTIQ